MPQATRQPRRRANVPQATRPAPEPETQEPVKRTGGRRRQAEPIPERITELANLGDIEAPAGTPDWLIARAKEYDFAKAQLQTLIADNRDALRSLKRMQGLSEDQVEFLELFYQEKTMNGQPKAAADIKEGRQLHEAVRKLELTRSRNR